MPDRRRDERGKQITGFNRPDAENKCSFDKLPPEEAQELRRRGQEKAADTRRRRKKMREALEEILTREIPAGKLRKELEAV